MKTPPNAINQITNVLNERVKAIATMFYKGYQITFSTLTPVNSVAVWSDKEQDAIFTCDTVEQAIDWIIPIAAKEEKDAATLKDHMENLT